MSTNSSNNKTTTNRNRHRSIAFTWNNWQEDFSSREAVVEYFKQTPHIKYFILGFEQGEEKQTHHIQGVLQFKQQKDFSVIRDIVKNNHLDIIYDLKGIIEYCSKGGDFVEFGKRPSPGKQDISDFRDSIIQGYSNSQLALEYPGFYFKYQRMIDVFRKDVIFDEYKTKLRKDLKVIYMQGTTGVGKSRFIYEQYSADQVYTVSGYDHPFDDYSGQSVLVLDEFHSDIKINEILKILDIYPTQLQARYSNKVACYTTVYIISNLPQNEQYLDQQRETRAAFNRRIHYRLQLNQQNYKTEIEKLQKYLLT